MEFKSLPRIEPCLARRADETVIVPMSSLEGDEPGAADTWFCYVSSYTFILNTDLTAHCKKCIATKIFQIFRSFFLRTLMRNYLRELNPVTKGYLGTKKRLSAKPIWLESGLVYMCTHVLRLLHRAIPHKS